MLVDLSHIAANPVLVAGAVGMVLVLKAAVVIGVVLMLGPPVRTAVISAFALAQVGEFSFLLAQTGEAAGLMDPDFYQSFYAVTLLGMLTTPLLMAVGPALGERLQRLAPGSGPVPADEPTAAEAELHDHVIIVGYGLNGRNVTSVLRETGIPYVVAEINVDLYREAVAAGHRAMYGDGTREAILSGLGIARARALVVAISDPLATRMIIRAARLLNGNVFLIARTRYVSEIGELSAMGADEVIPEEFETSIEIFTRVLRKYHLPRNVIAAQVELLRREGYGMMRGMKLPDATMDQIETILAAGTTDTFLVLPDSPSVGKMLQELDIRKRTGASVLTIVRDGKPIVNPPPETPLAGGDILVLIGTHLDVDRAFDVLEGKAGTGSRTDRS